LAGGLRQSLGQSRPNAAASFYTDHATYQVTPCFEPLRGRAILDCWTHVAKTDENVQFHHEILTITPDPGFAHWQACFTIQPQTLHTKLVGIFLISLDSSGLCTSLRERWHKPQ